MTKDKQNIKTTDWLTRGIPKEQLERKKREAIREAEAELHNKQIEELEKLIVKVFADDYNQGCDPDAETTAKAVYEAGWRRQSEVVKIFEKLKVRECSNSVCAWCVHATAYGRRNEECDKPYIDKNGKEQKACYAYAKFESLIDNELANLKKKYTEEKTNEAYINP